MIRISAEQVRAFEDREMHRFIGRIVDELPGYRPEPVAGRSRATLFAMADTAVQRAKTYNVETERGFWLYANIAASLGVFFDVNPSFLWATDILSDQSYLSDEKMNDLWNACSDWCAAVLPEGDYLPFEAYERYLALDAPMAGHRPDVPALLYHLWPERLDQLDDQRRAAFIRQSEERARGFGLNEPASIACYTAISFLIGFAFESDPLHDWSREIPAIAGPDTDLAAAKALDEGFRERHLLPALKEGN